MDKFECHGQSPAFPLHREQIKMNVIKVLTNSLQFHGQNGRSFLGTEMTKSAKPPCQQITVQ